MEGKTWSEAAASSITDRLKLRSLAEAKRVKLEVSWRAARILVKHL